ncbi:MAG: hypothetical protein F4W90_02650 [Gammaproteobacteria bacterium]|nr:hypothetical protein [Gammaproteobacteria bacterium]
MKYKFPPPPNFHGDQIGPDVPSRLKSLEIQYCDGAGVCVRLEYDNADQTDSHRISMSLPASLKLASELSAAVNEYLYNTGEEVNAEQP